MSEKRPCGIPSHGYGCMTGTASHDRANLSDAMDRLRDELRKSAASASARFSAAFKVKNDK